MYYDCYIVKLNRIEDEWLWIVDGVINFFFVVFIYIFCGVVIWLFLYGDWWFLVVVREGKYFFVLIGG